MPPRHHLTIEERGRALGLLESGQSQRQVARTLAVSQSVVSRLQTRYNNTGQVRDRPRSGRPRATTQRQDRFLVTLARRNRFDDASNLNRQFHQATGVRITPQTLRNRLHAANFRGRRPAVRPILLPRHRQARLLWARNHVRWQRRHWRPVLFTDESRFCLDFNDGRRRVWRQPGERYADCNIAQHDRFGGGSIMVWGGISLDGRTDLYAIRNGALTAIRYRDEILHPIVRPFAGAIGPDFVLMDDNARPHRAGIVRDYLENETIERMDGPAVSPDRNPIEHIGINFRHACQDLIIHQEP